MYTSIGEYTVTMTATNDLGSDSIQQIVEVVEPGNIAVDPEAITVTLGIDELGYVELLVSNTGMGELHVEVDDLPGWISPSVPQFVVPANSTATLGLYIDTTGMLPGTYQTELLLLSDDPDQPELPVVITLVIGYETFLPLVLMNWVP
jgi:PKD repeat protein